MVQNFMVFIYCRENKDHEKCQPSTSYALASIKSLMVGVASLEHCMVRNLEPQKFLLKAWMANPQNFAPAKISRYTVLWD